MHLLLTSMTFAGVKQLVASVCDCVCLFVHMIKPKWLKLKSPNLAQG